MRVDTPMRMEWSVGYYEVPPPPALRGGVSTFWIRTMPLEPGPPVEVWPDAGVDIIWQQEATPCWRARIPVLCRHLWNLGRSWSVLVFDQVPAVPCCVCRCTRCATSAFVSRTFGPARP
jgi:hypothetical protein